MDEGRLGRGQPRMGEWLGDYEDLVGHQVAVGAAGGEPSLQVCVRWNPVTYRCAFCDESFVSRAMIRRVARRVALEVAEGAQAVASQSITARLRSS